MNRYKSAKELYAKIGVDTDEALKKLAKLDNFVFVQKRFVAVLVLICAQNGVVVAAF